MAHMMARLQLTLMPYLKDVQATQKLAKRAKVDTCDPCGHRPVIFLSGLMNESPDLVFTKMSIPTSSSSREVRRRVSYFVCSLL